jgi:hypothetical protein
MYCIGACIRRASRTDGGAVEGPLAVAAPCLPHAQVTDACPAAAGSRAGRQDTRQERVSEFGSGGPSPSTGGASDGRRWRASGPASRLVRRCPGDSQTASEAIRSRRQSSDVLVCSGATRRASGVPRPAAVEAGISASRHAAYGDAACQGPAAGPPASVGTAPVQWPGCRARRRCNGIGLPTRMPWRNWRVQSGTATRLGFSTAAECNSQPASLLNCADPSQQSG